MENKKVAIKSLVNHTVVIDSAEYHISRVWEKKGVVRMIDLDTLQDLIYEPGIEVLFRDGYLGIDDMEVKKFIGLEPEDATEPTLLVLTDTQKDNLLKNKPMFEFKQIVDEMSYNQAHELALYAIDNNILINFDKNEYFLKRVGKNVMKSIENSHKIKED